MTERTEGQVQCRHRDDRPHQDLMSLWSYERARASVLVSDGQHTHVPDGVRCGDSDMETSLLGACVH